MTLSAQSQDGQTSEGMPRSQQEGIEEPERDHQQEDQTDAIGGEDIADYDPEVDYGGSEPVVEQSAQEQREVDPDAEYAEMEIPQDGTLHQRMMPWDQYGDPVGT